VTEEGPEWLWRDSEDEVYMFPVSTFRQQYTSPNPPQPMILCTLKSFMVNCKVKT
jgi:hypothetical protein